MSSSTSFESVRRMEPIRLAIVSCCSLLIKSEQFKEFVSRKVAIAAIKDVAMLNIDKMKSDDWLDDYMVLPFKFEVQRTEDFVIRCILAFDITHLIDSDGGRLQSIQKMVNITLIIILIHKFFQN